MNYCPCCSSQLLRHTRGTQVYWFCRNCWQIMPIIQNWKQCNDSAEFVLEESARTLQQRETPNAEVYLQKGTIINGLTQVENFTQVVLEQN
ncbi:MAG: hypothetical protein ACHBN1_12525 [Heteroscytonema crispum UTEX LB 1556]